MSDALVERLAQLDTCVVSDALDRLGANGVTHGIRRLWPCPRVAGRAVTVQLGPPAATAGDAPHLGARAIDAAGPEHVIVVANEGRLEMGGWGGLLSLAAARRGIRGVVVDGACRDVDDAEALGFPLFARAPVPVTARGRVVELSTNVPVRIDEVAVAPGDLVLADGTGVVFVPAGAAKAALATAEELAAREAELAARLEAGAPASEVLGGGYEEMLRP